MSAQIQSSARPARVEVVDSWHARWPEALALAERLGQRSHLEVDADGWLSARQVLLVAFGQKLPVGFVCFDLLPQQDVKGHVLWQEGRPVLVARVRSLVVDPSKEISAKVLRNQLLDAARSHALELNCQEFETAA